MKTLGDYSREIRESISAMPLQSRAIAILLIGVIVIGVGLLLRSSSENSGQYLFNGKLFSEDEIRRAELAFGSAGLKDYEFVGSRVRVPSATRDSYLRALSDAGAIPAGTASATGVALDKTSIFDSQSKVNQRMMVAKEGDIAKQIERFHDVKKATVFYDMHRAGFSGVRQQSAAVIVVPFGNDTLSYYRKKEIAELVSAAYAGLSPDNVRVSDANGRGTEEDPWIDEDDKHYRMKKYYERLFSSKIQQALVGYGPPQVVVDVELDPKLEERTHTVTLEANPTTLEETSVSRSSETTRPNTGGVPGVASNAFSNQATRIEESLDRTKETETNEHSIKDVGKTHTQSITAGLRPIRTSVLISLRSSFYDDLWRVSWLAENPGEDVPPLNAAKREELRTTTKQEITEAVKTIIQPLRAGDDTTPLVTVLDYPDLPVAETLAPEEPSAAVQFLAQSWQSIALGLITLFALFVAWGSLKSPPPAPAPEFDEAFGLEIPAPPADELALSEEEEAGAGLSMDMTGTNLKDELNTIIEQNPDAAANVLRTWLSDAA